MTAQLTMKVSESVVSLDCNISCGRTTAVVRTGLDLVLALVSLTHTNVQ